jgi:hypothetical protein
MSSYSLHQEDYYVILQPDLPEEILTKEELVEKLSNLLKNFPDSAPGELAKLSDLGERALFLRDNYCQWDIAQGEYLQWYAIRLEK